MYCFYIYSFPVLCFGVFFLFLYIYLLLIFLGCDKFLQLHIESHHDPASPEDKEVDFFSEHTQESASDFQAYPVEDSARLGGTATSAAKPVNGNGKANEGMISVYEGLAHVYESG